MFRFIELAQLPSAASLACDYDIAFVGNPIDERGRVSVAKARSAAKSCFVVGYDSDAFCLLVDGENFPANSSGFRCLLTKYAASRVLLDATTLEFPELLLLIKAHIQEKQLEVGFLYAEPDAYQERDGLDAEDLHAFSLREGYQKFAPIPGFTPMLSDARKARLIAFVGFESTRLRRVLIEDEGARIKAFLVVFGVPPFKANWEMHSFMQNAYVLKEATLEDILFAGANNPRSAYQLICRVAKTCCPKSEVVTLAPLGTKPMSIAVALYAAQHTGVRVVYDYPKTRLNCTSGIGKIHHFVVRLSQL